MKNPTVNIRLMGDPEIVQQVINGIRINEDRCYMEVSRPYHNRGNTDDVRVYITITGLPESTGNRREVMKL